MRISMSMVLLFVAVFIDGVSNFAAAQQTTAPVPVNWDALSKHVLVLLILGAIGAIGGYLSARQKELAEGIPFHMVQGAAGAVIIVTLAPVDQTTVDNLFIVANTPFIKFVALALIGGYAGGSLLESSVGQLAKGINELKENQNKLAEETKKGLDALRTAVQILRGLQLSSPEIRKFEIALQDASPSTRFDIAYRADESRREKHKEAIERSLLIFESLVKTKDAATNHWWYASLGYCLKDKSTPDYAAAFENFSTAIRIRGDEMKSGAYEFNRAFCNIKLDPGQQDWPASERLEKQIRMDLDVARQFERWKDITDKDVDVQTWLKSRLPVKEADMHPT
jgi:hypothetical protein